MRGVLLLLPLLLACDDDRPPPAKKTNRIVTKEKLSVGALLERARSSVEKGDLRAARRDYGKAGRMDKSEAAETALLELAELELEARRPKAAMAAVAKHRWSFADSPKAPTAAWYAVRALALAGDAERALREAEELTRKWPDSAEAKLAAELLAKN